MTAVPRPRPCPSCPYRRDVPSGIWEESEYVKLPGYDGEPHEQATQGALGSFFCHQADGHLCSGWVGHRDPYDLLALRLGVAAGQIDPVSLEYTTDVPLFSSGAEAAAHGLKDIEEPGLEARVIVDKIKRRRGEVL